MNKENIEERIFDYHEGNLTPSEMEEVENFISDNPEFRSDFNAWNASYFEERNIKYPHEKELLADTGGMWMRWSAILLLLLGLGASAFWIFNPTKDVESTKHGSSLTEVEGRRDVVSLSGYDESSIVNHTGNQAKDPLSKAGKDNKLSSPIYNSQSGSAKNSIAAKEIFTLSGLKDHSQSSASDTKRSISYKINADPASAFKKDNKAFSKTHDSSNKAAKTDFEKDTDYMENDYSDSDNINLIASGALKYAESKKEKDPDSNPALDQALSYFKESNFSGVNDRNYFEPFPNMKGYNLSSGKSSSRKNRPFKRMMEIMDEYLIHTPHNYGFRNFNEPYYVIPEFYSPMFHNGGFTGSGRQVVQLKTAYRYSGIHTATLAVDNRIDFDNKVGIGNDPGIGWGLTFKSNYYNDDTHELIKSDVALHVSPKIKLNDDFSIAPSLGINYSDIQAKFLTNDNLEIELDKGRTYAISNILETDTAYRSNVSTHKMDYNAGFLLDARTFYLGFNVYNLLNTTYRTDLVDIHGDLQDMRTYTIVAGTDYKYSQTSDMRISPNFIYRQTGSYKDVWFGINWKYKAFLLGGSYGSNKEAAMMIGLQNNKVRLGFKVDYTENLINNTMNFNYGGTFRLWIGKKASTKDLPPT